MNHRLLEAMRRRLGGWSWSPRERLMLDRKHQCPGWIGHDHPRRDVVFNRRQKITYRHGHLAYAMYWRLHPVATPHPKEGGNDA